MRVALPTDLQASCCLGLWSHHNGVGIIATHYDIWLYVGSGHLNSDPHTRCTSYFSVAVVNNHDQKQLVEGRVDFELMVKGETIKYRGSWPQVAGAASQEITTPTTKTSRECTGRRGVVLTTQIPSPDVLPPASPHPKDSVSVPNSAPVEDQVFQYVNL